MERTRYEQTLPRTELFTLALPSPSGCARGLCGQQGFKRAAPGENQWGQGLAELAECWLEFCHQWLCADGGKGWAKYSHMDMENSSLATLQGRQSMNTCWIMNLLSQQISHDQQVVSFPADSGTLQDFWSCSSAIFFLYKTENKQNRQLVYFGCNVFKDSLTASGFFHVFCHFGCEGVFKSAFQLCTYSILWYS